MHSLQRKVLRTICPDQKRSDRTYYQYLLQARVKYRAEQ